MTLATLLQSVLLWSNELFIRGDHCEIYRSKIYFYQLFISFTSIMRLIKTWLLNSMSPLLMTCLATIWLPLEILFWICKSQFPHPPSPENMSYFCGDVGINGTVYVFSTVPEGMKGQNTVGSNISLANFM